MKKLGIICAMKVEMKKLLSSMENVKETKVGESTFYEGNLYDHDVVLVLCGVGKVNAAIGTQILIDRYGVETVINSGIAGGAAEGLSIGDIVIGTDFVQHDFDVTAFGHAKGYLCTGDDDSEPTVFSADKRLVEELADAVRKISVKRKVHLGRIASGDLFIADCRIKRKIAKKFAALATEMEGAAIAQTASYNNVPFAVIRVISDLADGTAPESYDCFEKESAEFSAEAVKSFVSSFK